MKQIPFLFTGILFGIVMTKSEAISWFRIQEMFRFESFHMYGIIGVAVVLGVIMHLVMQKKSMKSFSNRTLAFAKKENGFWQYILGGSIFGLGWAMTGACPGPLFTLIGHGIFSILLVIASGVLGTYVYGALKNKLPH